MENQNDMMELILKSVDTGLDRKEARILASWINSSVDNRNLYDEYVDILITSRTIGTRHPFNSAAAFNRFKELTAQEESLPVRKTPFLRKIKRYSFISGIAACLVMIVGLAFYFLGQGFVDNRISDVCLEVPYGSQLEVVLPDGSEVSLNSGSTFRYSKDFGRSVREVSLSGEAYFDVAKNPDVPFIVESGSSRTKVLGTKFNLKNFDEDSEVRLSLYEGSVEFSVLSSSASGICPIVLEPMQALVYDKLTDRTVIEHFSSDHHRGYWMDGCAVYDEMLLEDIMEDLCRIYNVQIEKETDRLGTRRFYFCADVKKQSIDQILDNLCLTSHLEYEKTGPGHYLLKEE